MTRRAPLVGVALALAASTLFHPAPASAQGRVARPRPVIVARPAVVVRPRTTVFIDGYYFPTFHRTHLAIGFGSSRRSSGYYGEYWPPFGFGDDHYFGAVRIEVSPREAEVYVDGYYAGVVDEFDGIFQRLRIEPGDHDLVIYADGYRPYAQQIYVQPGRTFSIRQDLQPLGPGEPVPPRPTGGSSAITPRPTPQGRPPVPPGTPPPGRVDPRAPGAPGAPGAPAAAGYGQFSLLVQPGDAELVIDGEVWAGAAIDERFVIQLPAGLHRIEIRKDGYRSYFTDITIEDGDTRVLNVALTRQ